MSTQSSNDGPKRPHATLDLKATEIKVSAIADKGTAKSSATAAPVKPEAVPMPAPASTYATKGTAGEASATASAKPAATSQATSSATSAPPSPAPQTSAAGRETIVVKKGGGFFSHLAASLAGGALALGAWAYGMPEMQKRGLLPEGLSLAQEGAAATSQTQDLAAKLQATQDRLAALEKTSAIIGEVKESQSRLVAETKAALAAAASDAIAPEQLERLAAVEMRLKALTDAGANDPGAGRLEQLAALTGKVADLETSLATQLTALRQSVTSDVEARLASASEAAESAKSGTQRIDRDLAGLKTETVKLDERVGAVKADVDRASEHSARAQEQLAQLKATLDSARAEAAKPSDVAGAIAPVSEKIAALEVELKNVVKAEAERRTNAERVVLALELQNLKRALDRGQSFEAELAEVEKASSGKLDLSPLAAFKQQGVPTLADLNRDLRPSVNAMIDAETAPEGESVVDRLIAGARSVVRVRRTNISDSDTSAEAIASRMEKAVKDGRLGDVLAESEGLSPKAKAAAQPFLDKVAARATVEKALASLEDQLKSSLTGAAPDTQTKTQ